jgi:hypothetical protein
MPYACADNDGTPAAAPNADSFAHWCLLFGCVEYTNNPDTVFRTTYGVYQEVYRTICTRLIRILRTGRSKSGSNWSFGPRMPIVRTGDSGQDSGFPKTIRRCWTA